MKNHGSARLAVQRRTMNKYYAFKANLSGKFVTTAGGLLHPAVMRERPFSLPFLVIVVKGLRLR